MWSRKYFWPVRGAQNNNIAIKDESSRGRNVMVKILKQAESLRYIKNRTQAWEASSSTSSKWLVGKCSQGEAYLHGMALESVGKCSEGSLATCMERFLTLTDTKNFIFMVLPKPSLVPRLSHMRTKIRRFHHMLLVLSVLLLCARYVRTPVWPRGRAGSCTAPQENTKLHALPPLPQ